MQVWVLPAQAAGSNPGLLNPVGTASSTGYNVGQGMKTGDAENLGSGSGNQFNEMAFSIEKVLVSFKSRALKAEYSSSCTGPEGNPRSER